MKIPTELQVLYSSIFSSPVDSIQAFGVDHIPFSSFQMPSHAGAPYIQSFHARYSIVPECSRYLEDSCFHSAFVILSSSFEVVISFKLFYSTGAISFVK